MMLHRIIVKIIIVIIRENMQSTNSEEILFSYGSIHVKRSNNTLTDDKVNARLRHFEKIK